MVSFATEFPISVGHSRADLVAQILSWLRGTAYSTVFEASERNLDSDSTHLRSPTGEELRLREFAGGSVAAIGFRHDFPDQEGRLWRTEGVLRRDATLDGQDLMRVRTECLARQPGARIEFPRKPYIIRSLLVDDWGGKDGEISVSDQPHWLADHDQEALGLARGLLEGDAVRYLPCVYVSAPYGIDRPVPHDLVSKLAYDLGGVAHVVIEPSRTFSFELKSLVAGANPYGGTISISLPDRGVVRQFYLGRRFSTEQDLVQGVREAALVYRSQMPANGLDWTELQEYALRQQRERDRARLSAEQLEALYQEEIENLQDRIVQLEAQRIPPPAAVPVDIDDALTGRFLDQSEPEIYPGEYIDRIRFAAKEVLARADQIGLDKRSRAVISAIASRLPVSPALLELIEDLKRATKDPKRIALELSSVLVRHGYYLMSEKRHVRLAAQQGYNGLETITIAKTPSDVRGLENIRKQIEGTLGIGRLANE